MLCDLNHLYKLWFPFPRMLHINLALICQAASEEKMIEIVDDDDDYNGRRSMGIL